MEPLSLEKDKSGASSPDIKGLRRQSVNELTQGEVEILHDRNGVFHRSFSPRQIHIISLGSNIGSGFFIGSGKAIANGGPGNVIIAYTLVSTCVWAVLQTLAEMTIAFPTSGNFIDYADRFVDPALAFAAGFAEWLGWTAVIGAEATFFSVIVRYWAPASVPEAAWLTIFLALCVGLFMLPNVAFAHFEYVTSMIKIFTFLILVFASLAIVCGAGPNGRVHHGETWTTLPPFKNGFAGFANCALLALWAVGDQVFTGIMGGEAQSPRWSLAHATKLVPYRVSIVYGVGLMFITILVPSNDPRLFGNAGVSASPFVIALNDAGIKGLPDFLNACMIFGILAIGAESLYIASRILRAMAHQQLVPEFIAKVDAKGRPRWAIGITGAVAILLTYINLSGTGAEIFTWLVSITSSSFFIVWIVIVITSVRFHAALKAQNDPLFTQIYAWRSTAWPLAPAWLMIMSILLLVSCFYAGLIPLGGAEASVYNFFEYMIGVVIVLGFTLIFKLVKKTKFRSLDEIDLRTGRRELSVEEIQFLDAYYKQSKWRRFGGYVQLW